MLMEGKMEVVSGFFCLFAYFVFSGGGRLFHVLVFFAHAWQQFVFF